MPSIFDTTQHEHIIATCAGVIEKDERFLLAWLEGSFARGTADRYSDIDLHLALDDDDVEQFTGERTKFLEQLGKTIYIREQHFGGSNFVALYECGISVDLTVEKISQVNARPREPVRIIFDRDDYEEELDIEQTERLPEGYYIERISREIGAFWFLVSKVPRTFKRGAPVSLCQSYQGRLRNLLSSMIILTRRPENAQYYERAIRSRLNDEEMFDLESTVHNGNRLSDVWKDLTCICKLYSKYARRACASFTFHYPEEIESTVKRYIVAELGESWPSDEYWTQ